MRYIYVIFYGADAETSLTAKSLLNSLQTKKFANLLVFFGRLYDYSDFVIRHVNF